MLRKKYTRDIEVQKQLDDEYEEINLFRKYSKAYGYEFYIARKTI
jgi:hypothetical protein